MGLYIKDIKIRFCQSAFCRLLPVVLQVPENPGIRVEFHSKSGMLKANGWRTSHAFGPWTDLADIVMKCARISRGRKGDEVGQPDSGLICARLQHHQTTDRCTGWICFSLVVRLRISGARRDVTGVGPVVFGSKLSRSACCRITGMRRMSWLCHVFSMSPPKWKIQQESNTEIHVPRSPYSRNPFQQPKQHRAA